MKARPGDGAEATAFLDGFRWHMGEACVSSISEVFDAQPHTPRWGVAQAWSVAEVLRCLIKTAN
nr:amylo-alpha-1,6-glucosidase [Gemmata massiliana]